VAVGPDVGSLAPDGPRDHTWDALRWWGEWAYRTCIAFGASPHTAHFVAGHFTDGLRLSWEL